MDEERLKEEFEKWWCNKYGKFPWKSKNGNYTLGTATAWEGFKTGYSFGYEYAKEVWNVN